MILQVALDFVDLERAIKIGREVYEVVDWIEAGTPLIKAVGMEAVRALKKAFPEKTIVADLKIADTGDIETEAAAKAGAGVVTVLGMSDDQTILQSVETARNFGCKVMVDLLNVQNLEERARRAEELGADYIMVHTGIDQQMVGKEVFGDLKVVSGIVDIPIAVGGGLDATNVQQAVKGGGEIIVVGGAITKAPNARVVAKKIKDLMRDLHLEAKSQAPLKRKKVEEMLDQVSTANITDAMHRRGEMRGIKYLSVPKKFFGKAFTVRAYPGDWSKVVQAIDMAKRGDVIVVDAHESRVALWGELATRSALRKRIAGLVIDGGVRDIEEIKNLDFPIYGRCVSPTAGEPKGMGEVNVTIKCGGVEVNPGDYIVADEDGVVVIPKKRAYEIASRALYVKEKEDRIRKEIEEGKTLGEILELKKWEKL